jgi:hypothetical protein
MFPISNINSKILVGPIFEITETNSCTSLVLRISPGKIINHDPNEVIYTKMDALSCASSLSDVETACCVALEEFDLERKCGKVGRPVLLRARVHGADINPVKEIAKSIKDLEVCTMEDCKASDLTALEKDLDLMKAINTTGIIFYNAKATNAKSDPGIAKWREKEADRARNKTINPNQVFCVLLDVVVETQKVKKRKNDLPTGESSAVEKPKAKKG